MSNIPEFSVTEISNLTKSILEENFNLIRVKGEISSVKNFKGHIYFSIKDDTNILNAVCWASNVPFLEVQPEDGIEVVAEGKTSSYSKGSISSYQLQINKIEIKGEGALLKLFEQRKKKLEAEGVFDESNKKKIPFLPTNIGVITSPSGAVIMDIIDRIQARFPTNIKLYPATVQGPNACKEIIEGLNYFENKKIDVVIVARGGGGIEDFIPFNEEKLIRRVFNYKIPLISAVGHETDFTLLDFVSDLRAATPTAAAELVVPELKNLKEKSNFLLKNLIQKTVFFVNNLLKELKTINSILAVQNFKKINLNYSNTVQNLNRTIRLAMSSFVKLRKAELEVINSSLKNLNIENTLKRGFVILKNKKGKLIKNSKKLEQTEYVNIQFYNELIKADFKIKK
jgi:exodeoxyribonuclease VII large subunit